jgi:hypothetical protein
VARTGGIEHVIALVIARLRSDRFAGWLLALGERRQSAVLVALAWALASRPLPVVHAEGPIDRKGGDLLVLDKAGGTEDVLAAVAGRIPRGRRVLALSRLDVRRVFKALTGPDVFTTLTDSDYRPGHPDVEEGKRRYRMFLVDVLRHYRRFTGVSAITTANVRFRSERELAAACTDVGIAFVPLHKESISTTAQRSWITRGLAELSGQFKGRAIAVYNEEERDGFITSGFAPADAVHVVGCPRMDVLHRLREQRSTGATLATAPVVLFSIDVESGTWTPFDRRLATGAPRWERLAALTEEAFLAAARHDPERPYRIKAKIGREDQQVVRLPQDLPANLEIVTGGLATGLIRSAAAVVGFNSTVLLEAVAAGVPAVVPRYAEAAASGAADWMFALGGAVTLVDDPAALRSAIDAAVARGPSAALTPEAVAALERYVGNADGRAGERAWRFLSEAMGIAPHQAQRGR